MLETDFILMMTAGFLLAPEPAKEKMIPDFEAPYELNEIKAPGRVSIGGMADDKPMAWKKWIEEIRASGIRTISVSYIPYDRSGLAPHIAAAFAGVISYVLVAETSSGRKCWYLRSEYSARTAITAKQFADFVDVQPEKSICWQRIHFLINESNGLNNRPLVAEGATADFLRSAEGESTFDFLGDNLLSEIQIECEIRNGALSFPAEWEPFFNFPLEHSAFFGAADGKEPVYFYPLREVSAIELKEIIAAQPFAAEIRPALARQLHKDPPTALGGVTDPDLLLAEGTNEQLQTLANLVCQTISGFCQEKEILPVIPSSLAESFGPDETDQRRARARGHTEKFRSFKPMENPWRYYQFESISGETGLPVPQEPQTIDEQFRGSLEAISRFAEKQSLTWFAGAFRTAAWLLKQIPANQSFVAEDILAGAIRDGMPEEVKDALTDGIFYVSKMSGLGWPVEKCFGLLAVSITNVFGGMGSWNDMSFEEDMELYNRVSADFFLAREHYFARELSAAE